MSKIVNWSCYATLWDRIIVEGVKRAQFEDKIENGNLKDKELAEYVGRMRSQDVVLDELKKEFKPAYHSLSSL